MFDFLSNFFVQALIFIVLIGLIWVGLRFIFRFTTRILSIGCAVIVFLGICYLVFRVVF